MAGGQFVKGQSGNPNGRPKGVSEDDVKKLARDHTTAAIETLVAIATTGRGEAARVSAAIAILDRGWGRPKQEIDLDANVSVNSDADIAEAFALVDQLARARAAGFEFADEMDPNRSTVAGHA